MASESPPTGPRALWVEGKMRGSQILRGPFGITFKTLRLALHSLLPCTTELGIGREAGRQPASSLLLRPPPLCQRNWIPSPAGLWVFLSSLMLFPAAVHSCFSPAPMEFHAGSAPSSSPPPLGLLFSETVATRLSLSLPLPPLCASPYTKWALPTHHSVL